jgi:hypothetical protein
MVLCVAGALVVVARGASTRTAPGIENVTALSAHPLALAEGRAGPINRFGFDLSGFGRNVSRREVLCEYPGGLLYRCGHEILGETRGLVRVVVAIPDLGRGRIVGVRFATAGGSAQTQVELTNPPRVLHEIETVSLEAGGAERAGGDGARGPVLALQQQQVTTMPSLAVQGPFEKASCDAIRAEWVGASATDPVFASAYGALHGGVVPLGKPPGAGVDASTPPQWLVTYPRGATRAHFIAHYEVVYRAGICPERILRGG